MTTDWRLICVMSVYCGWVTPGTPISLTLIKKKHNNWEVVIKAKHSDWLKPCSTVLVCSLYLLLNQHRYHHSKKKKKKHPVRCHSCTYIFKTQHLWHWQNNKSRPWHSTGNAGFRLHFPAHFELVGDQEARRQDSGGEQSGMEQLPRPQPVARSVETCIGQKLQLIGDQFHREHLQLVRRKCASSQTLWPLVWW